MSFTQKAKSFFTGKTDTQKEDLNSLKTKLEEKEDLLRAFEAYQTDYISRQKEKEQQQDFVKIIETLEADFIAKHPDYNNATAFLKTKRDTELSKWGFEDKEMREHIIGSELLGLAKQAISMKLNPAEIAYAQAESSGYKPSKKNNDSEVEALKENIKKTKSAGQIAGQSAPNASAETLANMNDDDFQSFWNDVIQKK